MHSSEAHDTKTRYFCWATPTAMAGQTSSLTKPSVEHSLPKASQQGPDTDCCPMEGLLQRADIVIVHGCKVIINARHKRSDTRQPDAWNLPDMLYYTMACVLVIPCNSFDKHLHVWNSFNSCHKDPIYSTASLHDNNIVCTINGCLFIHVFITWLCHVSSKFESSLDQIVAVW